MIDHLEEKIHLRPEGFSYGTYCGRCGQPSGTMGHGKCDPHPEFVRELKRLNRVARPWPLTGAAYDVRALLLSGRLSVLPLER